MAIRTLTTHTCMGLIRDKHIKCPRSFLPEFKTMGLFISFEEDLKVCDILAC